MDDPDDQTMRARAKWHHTGRQRPEFALAPRPGQESVWDYPRPPRMAADVRVVRVVAFGVSIAATHRAVRVLETGSPPTFYLPPDDVRTDLLAPDPTTTYCEWKGHAAYFSVCVGGRTIAQAAWRYSGPYSGYESIAGYFAFYPQKLACYVGEERVRPQPGAYYGGWVTREVVGPFKGQPGTEEW